MSAIVQKTQKRIEAATVLSKAVARAAEHLDVSQPLLSQVLSLDPPLITRLCSGDYLLDEDRKEWGFALLFLRLFNSLDALTGDESTARTWLNGQNHGLNGKPTDLIGHTDGLVRVIQYLDASRSLV